SPGSKCRKPRLELRPGAVLLRRFHTGLDEGDAFDTVLDRRVDHVLGQLAALLARRADRPRRFRIDVGEAFEITLRMARRDAADARGGRAGPGAGARQQLFRLAERRVPEIVRIGLCPFEAALLAIHPELEAVLVAGRHLARPDHSLGAALEAQHDVSLV